MVVSQNRSNQNDRENDSDAVASFSLIENPQNDQKNVKNDRGKIEKCGEIYSINRMYVCGVAMTFRQYKDTL